MSPANTWRPYLLLLWLINNLNRSELYRRLNCTGCIFFEGILINKLVNNLEKEAVKAISDVFCWRNITVQKTITMYAHF